MGQSSYWCVLGIRRGNYDLGTQSKRTKVQERKGLSTMNENMANGAMALSDDDLDLLVGGILVDAIREKAQAQWSETLVDNGQYGSPFLHE